MSIDIRVCTMLAGFLLLVSGCTTDLTRLGRAQESYESAAYGDVRSWLAACEQPPIEHEERLRFHYLSGMTSYRLGEREDALYHLALARGLSEASENDWWTPAQRRRLDVAMLELSGATVRVSTGGESTTPATSLSQE